MTEDQDEISKTINRIHELVTPFVGPLSSPTCHQVYQYYLRGKNAINTFGASINIWVPPGEGIWVTIIKAKGTSQLEVLQNLQKKLEATCRTYLKQRWKKKIKLDAEIDLLESLLRKDK